MAVVRNPVWEGPDEMDEEELVFTQEDNHIESLVQVLDLQGFENTSFAIVALNGDGNAEVHTSGRVRGFFDETLLATKFEEAHSLSLHHDRRLSSEASSPERDVTVHSTPFFGRFEEELMRDQQPSVRATGRPLSRTVRQRGRSTLTHDFSQFSVASSPKLAVALTHNEQRTPGNDNDRIAAVKRNPMKSFRIDSELDVTGYMESRLKRLQQLAGKKIAKAWIKGICPKKQARFPYQNKQRHAETGELPRIPGWWPQESGICRFIEPDHIRREERMKLCLHLLRLRPSPAQLRAWNDDTTEDNKTHVLFGWTEFLKELAGPKLFDDLPKEAPNRVKLRQTLLMQMYAVAALEEQFHKDEIDGGMLFFYEDDEDEERRPTISKRSRRSSATSSVGEVSRPSSVPASCTRAKRLRMNTEQIPEQTVANFGMRCDSIEKSGAEPEQVSHQSSRQSTSRSKLPIVPDSPLNNIQGPSADGLSSWVSVQVQSQHAQGSATALADATFARPDPNASIASRRRALRAQRKMQAEHLGVSSTFSPVKQEARAWRACEPSHWLGTTMSLDSRHAGLDSDHLYSTHRAPDGPSTRDYDLHHYLASSFSDVPESMPNTSVYSNQSLLDPEFCTPLDYGAHSGGATMQHGGSSTQPIDSLHTTGPQAASMTLQQSAGLQSWPHVGLPECHEQLHPGVPDLYYAQTNSAWGNHG